MLKKDGLGVFLLAGVKRFDGLLPLIQAKWFLDWFLPSTLVPASCHNLHTSSVDGNSGA